jgi:deaminated glutathione amidase
MIKFAIIQMTSVLDPAVNIAKLDSLISKGKAQGANAFFLPEVFYSIANGLDSTPHLVEPGNQHEKNIFALAKRHQVYLIGGSAATKIDGKIYNRIYNINPQGEMLTSYDKIHLFALSLKDREKNMTVDEAKIYTAGHTPRILELDQYQIAMSLCFDLRFPKLYRDYSAQGANIISISSAFTVPTGRAHWEVLLRARAIENQCYVVASAQWGVHNERVSTWGYSMVVDPWGEVVVNLEEGEGVALFDVDLNHLANVRQRLPVLGRE